MRATFAVVGVLCLVAVTLAAPTNCDQNKPTKCEKDSKGSAQKCDHDGSSAAKTQTKMIIHNSPKIVSGSGSNIGHTVNTNNISNNNQFQMSNANGNNFSKGNENTSYNGDCCQVPLETAPCQKDTPVNAIYKAIDGIGGIVGIVG